MSSPEQSPIDRYYTAWAIVGEIVAVILTSAAAKLIGKRLTVLAESGWLPGMGDARLIGALTNRPEASIASIVGDRPRVKHYVGRQPFYRLSDFAQDDSKRQRKRGAK